MLLCSEVFKNVWESSFEEPRFPQIKVPMLELLASIHTHINKQQLFLPEGDRA